MLGEFKKSIESILYQRVTSPFYGTLFTTWMIWNWRAWYIALFVDSSSLKINKLNYIISECDDGYKLFVFPILSTVFILTL